MIIIWFSKVLFIPRIVILIWIGSMLLDCIRLTSRGSIRGRGLFRLCRLIIAFTFSIRVLCLLPRVRLSILGLFRVCRKKSLLKLFIMLPFLGSWRLRWCKSMNFLQNLRFVLMCWMSFWESLIRQSKISLMSWGVIQISNEKFW